MATEGTGGDDMRLAAVDRALLARASLHGTGASRVGVVARDRMDRTPSPGPSQEKDDPEVLFSPRDRARLVSQAKEKFRAYTDMPLDLRAFSLLHGDAFTLDSELEGGFVGENAKYIQATVDKLLEDGIIADPDGKVASVTRELANLTTWDAKFRQAQRWERETMDVAKELMAAIRALPSGGSVLLSGGYIKSGGGHAMLYRFEKEPTGNYNVSIFNSGDGLQYHPSVLHGFKSKSYPVLKFTNVTEEDLFYDPANPSANFLDALIKFKCHSVKNPTNKLYGVIFRRLKDRIFPVNPSIKDCITNQRSGTCSRKCITSGLLRSALELDKYKEVMFYLKFSTLVHFFTKMSEPIADGSAAGRSPVIPINDISPEGDVLRRVLREACLNLMRTASKASKKDRVKKEALREALGFAQAALMTLREAESHVQRVRNLTDESFDLRLEAPAPKYYLTPPKEVPDAPREDLAKPPLLDLFENVKTDPTKILDAAIKCNELVANPTLTTEFRKAQVAVFIKALPALADARYWAALKEEDKKALMGYLHAILAHYALFFSRMGNYSTAGEKNNLISIYKYTHFLATKVNPKLPAAKAELIFAHFGFPDMDANSFRGEASADDLFLSEFDTKVRSENLKYFEAFRSQIGLVYGRFSVVPRASVLYLNPFYSIYEEKSAVLREFYSDERNRNLNWSDEHSERDWIVFELARQFYYPGSRDPYSQLGMEYVPMLHEMRIILGLSLSEKLMIGTRPKVDVFTFHGGVSQFVFNIEGWGGAQKKQPYIYYPGDKLERRRISSATANVIRTLEPQESGRNFPGQREAIIIQDTRQLMDVVEPSLARIGLSSIAHAAAFEETRPVDLLEYGIKNIDRFSSYRFQLAFEQQFLKIFHFEKKDLDRFSPLHFHLSNPRFQEAFLAFLKNANDFYLCSREKKSMSIVLFAMRLGVMVSGLANEKGLGEFSEEIDRMLDALDELKDADDITHESQYTIHLLRVLRFKGILERLFQRNEVLREAGSAVPKLMDGWSDDDIKKLMESWLFLRLTSGTTYSGLEVYTKDVTSILKFFASADSADYTRIASLFNEVKANLPIEGMEGFDTVTVLDRGLFRLQNPAGKTWTVDIVGGNFMSEDGAAGLYLDKDRIYSNDDFLKIFGTKKFVFTVRGDWVHFSDPKLGSFRFSLSKLRHGLGVVLYKNIGGEWCENVGALDCSETFFTTIRDDKVTSLAPLSLVADHTHWKGRNGIYCFSKETNLPGYLIRRDGKITFTDYDDDGNVVARGEVRDLSPDMKSLVGRFESTSFVVNKVSVDEATGTRVETLTFTRFLDDEGDPLVFEYKEGKLVWTKDPNFSVLPHKPIGTLEYFSNFLLLEHKDTTQQIALVPSLKYRDTKSNKHPRVGAGGVLDVFDEEEVSEKSFKLQNYLERHHNNTKRFLAIPLKEGEFNPINYKQLLLAAFIELGQHKYDEALFYLSQVNFSDLSERADIDLLNLIISYSCDNAPQFYAIVLRAQLISSRFLQKLGKPSSIYPSVYCKYLEALSNIGEKFRLSFVEEKDLISTLPFKPRAVEARESYLATPWIPVVGQAGLIRGKPFSINYITQGDRIRFADSEIPAVLPEITLEYLIRNSASLEAKTPILYKAIMNALGNPQEKRRLQEVFEHYLCLIDPDDRGIQFFRGMLDTAQAAPFPYFYEWKTSADADAERARVESRRRDDPYAVPPFNPYVCWFEKMTRHFSLIEGLERVVRVDPPPLLGMVTADDRGSMQIDHELAQIKFPTESTPLELTWKLADDSTHNFSTTNRFHRFVVSTKEVLVTLADAGPSLSYGDAEPEVPKVIEAIEMDVLGESSEDPVFGEAVRIEVARFKGGYEKALRKRAEQRVMDVDKGRLHEVKAQIDEELEYLEERLEMFKEEIIALANQSTGADDVLHRSHIITASGRKKLDVKKLTWLFLSGDKESFKFANPELRDADIQKLYDSIGEFLFLSIEKEQMERTRKIAASLLKELDENGLSSTAEALKDGVVEHPNIVQLCFNLLEVATQTIERDAINNPKHLVFLYNQHIMFRKEPDQASILEFMYEQLLGNTVSEVMMGGGKTSTVAPNQLAKAAAQGKIGILVTPSFQYRTIYEALRKSLKNGYDMDVITFDYTRTELSERILKYIHDTLVRVRDGQRLGAPTALVVCPELLQILELEFFALLNSMNSLTTRGVFDSSLASDEQKNKVIYLSQILRILKNDGVSFADEVHVVLDIQKEVNFPIGEGKKVDRRHVGICKDIFGILSSKKVSLTDVECAQLGITDLAELPSHEVPAGEGDGAAALQRVYLVAIDDLLGISQNRQSYFSPELFREIIVPKVAGILSRNPKLKLSEEEQRIRFQRYVTGQMNAKVQKALMSGSAAGLDSEQEEDLAFLTRLRNELALSDDKEEKKAADLIALSKHLLVELLPSTLSKTGNANFGRTRDPENPGEVVPFICADTPSKNKFGYHYEAVAYHFMIAMMYGVEKEQIRSVFESLHSQAIWFVKNRGLKYEDTPPAKDCLELFRFLPNQIEDHMDEIVERAAEDIDFRFKIEELTIDKFVQYFPSRLNSNAMSLAGITGAFHGFSGTPDPFTMPAAFQQEGASLLDPTVNPRVIHAMLGKSTSVSAFDGDTIGEVVDGLFAGVPAAGLSNTSGLLDLGGILKDYDNLDIARAILAKLGSIPGNPYEAVVVFVRAHGSTTADYPAILKPGHEPVLIRDTSASELKKYGLVPGNYFSFYDKRHCTGTDIKQSPSALNIVTFDPNVPLDDGTQGIMRLRQFLLSQKIHFAMPTTIAKSIPGLGSSGTVLSLIREGKPADALASITYAMMKTQAYSRARKMEKAFKRMISNAAFQAAKRAILRASTRGSAGIADMVRLCQAFRPSIFLPCEDAPYATFGSLDESIDIIDHLKQYQSEVLDRLRESLMAFGIDPKDPLEEIEAEHATILALAEEKRDHFAAEILSPVEKYEGGSEAGVEMQVAMEQVKEVDLDLERDLRRELQSYQKTYRMTPRDYSEEGFDDVYARISTGVGTRAMEDLFSMGPLERPYRQLFRSGLRFTQAFLRPFDETVSIFERRFRPFQYLVCQKTGDGLVTATVVSQKEAVELKKGMTTREIKDTWLMLPSGLLQAGDPETLKEVSSKQEFKDVMIEFNVLGLNADYLLKHLRDYKAWFTYEVDLGSSSGAAASGMPVVTPATLAQLRSRFIRMKAELNPISKEVAYRYLLNQDSIDDLLQLEARLATSTQLSSAAEVAAISLAHIHELVGPSVEHASAEQVRLFTEEHHADSIQYLKTREQIQALPDALVKHLTFEQMDFISLEQAKLIEKDECIKTLPKAIISALTLDSLGADKARRMIERLRKDQISWVADVKFLEFVPIARQKYISDALVDQIPTEDKYRSLFGALTNEHYKKATQEQMDFFFEIRLNADGEPADDESRRLLEKVKTFDSTEMIEKLPDNVLPLLEDDRLEYMTKEQVQRIEEADFIKRLPRVLFTYLRPAQVIELSDDQIGQMQIEDETIMKHVSADKIGLIPVDVRKEITDKDVIALFGFEEFKDVTRAQAEHVNMDVLHAIEDDDEIHALPAVLFKYLTKEQVEKLSVTQVGKIRYEEEYKGVLLQIKPEMFGHLNEETLLKIMDKEIIARFPKDLFRTINHEQIRLLSKEQVEHLTQDEYDLFGILSKDQIPFLNQVAVHTLSHAIDEGLMKALTDEQLEWLDVAQIQSIHNDDELLYKLSNEQLELLTEEQLHEIGAQKTLDRLSDEQLIIVSDEQLQKISPERTKAITTEELLHRLTPKMLESTDPDQMPLISVNQMPYILSSKHLQKAKFEQLMAIKADQLHMATAMQQVVYIISTIAYAIFSLIIMAPVELFYLLTMAFALEEAKEAHDFLMESISRFGEMLAHGLTCRADRPAWKALPEMLV